MHKASRNYENLNKVLFRGCGKYNIPQLRPVYQDGRIPSDWISFNYAKSCKNPLTCGVHFFIDDYQFIRLWNDPDRYIDMLRHFDVVMTPDFSVYTDMPEALQIYNHYRKHWLGAYWQAHGMLVIPTISWSDENSFEWCFDGEPSGGLVAVSSVGTQQNPDAGKLFEYGFKELIDHLYPQKIILYGSFFPTEYKDLIVQIEPFQNKWRNK